MGARLRALPPVVVVDRHSPLVQPWQATEWEHASAHCHQSLLSTGTVHWSPPSLFLWSYPVKPWSVQTSFGQSLTFAPRRCPGACAATRAEKVQRSSGIARIMVIEGAEWERRQPRSGFTELEP